MKLWDFVQGRSIYILTSFGPQGPYAKIERGGGDLQKNAKFSFLPGFFFLLRPAVQTFLCSLLHLIE